LPLRQCGRADLAVERISWMAPPTLAALMLFLLPTATTAQTLEHKVLCTITDTRLTEISGMTTSREFPEMVWVHNDSSDAARIYGIDLPTCETVAEVELIGVQARDIEAIARSNDKRGRSVLWIADIGDNRDSWTDVGLYRIREPTKLGRTARKAREFRFTYEDRPHNAETLLIDNNRIWIATWQLASGGLYELSRRSRSDTTLASRVGDVGPLITDGSIAPDGSGYVLRDYLDVHFFHGPPPGRRVATVALPAQVQGEALTWTADGSGLLIAGEDDDRIIEVAIPQWVRSAMRPPDHLASYR